MDGAGERYFRPLPIYKQFRKSSALDQIAKLFTVENNLTDDMRHAHIL